MVSRNAVWFASVVVGLFAAVNVYADGKRYLVQFKSPKIFFSVAQNMAMDNGAQRDSLHPATLFGTNATVTNTLQNVQMMIIESGDALTVEALKTHPAIALIEAEVFHPAPAPIATRTQGDSNVIGIQAGKTMDVPWGITAVKAAGAWSTTRGNGARVTVLDTGADKAHPALASRLEAGKNFTEEGDAADISDSIGHGSHVSGTILADGVGGGLVGVAPEAKLLMGKVCTDQGCSNIAIVSGIDWGVEQKVDVVSMSLGGAFLTAAEEKALQNAETAGVMVVAASGNDGRGTVSFPAAAPNVFAVGAIDSMLKKAEFSNWGPELAIVGPGVDVVSSVPRGTGRAGEVQIDLDGKGLNDIKTLPFVGSPVVAATTNNLVFAGLGKPEDFAKIDVKGKFALISRGEIPFKDKVTAAIGAGATGVVIFNNVPGLMQGTVSSDGSEVSAPVVMIEQSVGESAKAALAAGVAVRASVAVVRSDYASFQGTSMATPHVAGVAALVRAANKKLTPAEVRALLKATATPLTPNDQNQLGSGLVNAELAVQRASHFVPMQQAAN